MCVFVHACVSVWVCVRAGMFACVYICVYVMCVYECVLCVFVVSVFVLNTFCVHLSEFLCVVCM